MSHNSRRHAFGQHFLKDLNVIGSIVELTFDEVRRVNARTLLEIGPGTGAITTPLLDGRKHAASLKKFMIVEKDFKFANRWLEQTADHRDEIEVISHDFLHVDRELYLADAPVVVVSNLPYSAGTAILNSLTAERQRIAAMVLMFQAEVAHRLRAKPSEKAWGTLSLWTQNHWDVEKVVGVPPRSFVPPPKVDSEVVVLRPREVARIAETEGREELFQKLITVAFTHRRKMLRSGLPSGSVYFDALAKAGIEGTRRAESLNWDEWRSWFIAVADLSSDHR